MRLNFNKTKKNKEMINLLLYILAIAIILFAVGLFLRLIFFICMIIINNADKNEKINYENA